MNRAHRDRLDRDTAATGPRFWLWVRRLGVTAAAAATIPLLRPPAAAGPGLSPTLDALQGAWRPLTTLTLAGALALALLLVWSRGERGGRDLAVFLAGGALAGGILLGNSTMILEGEGFLVQLTALDALLLGAWMLAIAAFARFAISFPGPATLEDVTRAMSFGRREPSPPGRIARAVWWEFRHAWAIAALAVSLLALALAFGSARLGGAAFIVVGLFGDTVLLVAIVLVPRIHWKAEGRARRQTLWVALAVGLGFVLLPLAALLVDLLTITLVSGPAVTAWLDAGGAAPTFIALGGALFVAGLGMALFADGLFDPRLALRRSFVWGGLGVLLLFLFALVEEALQSLVLTRLGVASEVSAWVGGAAAALAFSPLRTRLERSAGSWLGPNRPDSDATTAPAAGTTAGRTCDLSPKQ